MTVWVKRRRRLVFLLAITTLVVAVAIGTYAWRKRQLQNQALASYQEGIASLEAGNHFDAMHKIGVYLHRYPNDKEALYRYANSRINVVEVGGVHILQTINMLRRLLQLQPNHADARRDLLRLYIKVGYRNESIDTANVILKQHPDDTEAVRAKSDAFIALRQFDNAMSFANELLDRENLSTTSTGIHAEALRAKTIVFLARRQFDEALPFSLEYNQLMPLDLHGHLMSISLLKELRHPSEEIVSRATELRRNHSDNPIFELLQAVAYRLTNDKIRSVKWLRTVAKRNITDEILIQRLVVEMDAAGIAREATSVIQTATENIDNIALRQTLVSRLIQGGHLDAVSSMIEKTQIDATSLTSDSELFGLYALALLQLDRKNDASPIIDILASRQDDRVAESWTIFLRNVLLQLDPSPSEIVKNCLDALLHHPENPYILYFLGQGYASLGDVELAIDAWRKASYLAPIWPKPLEQISRSLLRTEHRMLSVRAAEAAYQRAPNRIDTAITLAIAAAANLDLVADDKLRELLKLVDQIQKTHPFEKQTLPIHATLLARTGQQDSAKRLIRSALEIKPPLDKDTLLRLVQVSKEAHLGLEQDCLRLYQQVYGITPEIVLLRVIPMLANGEGQKGLEELEAASQNADSTQQTNWNIAIGRYLDRMNHPRAQSFWTRLADEMTDNLRVQQLTLESPWAWKNLDLIDRTITRVQNMSAEKGLIWRTAKARLLLAKSQGESEIAKAAEILSNVVHDAPTRVKPRLLLAQCYQILGNQSGAIEQLLRANQLRPKSQEIMLNLATLYKARGQVDQANIYLDQVINGETPPSPEVTRRAAELLIQQGNTDRALQLLEHAYKHGNHPSAANLAIPLGRLYLHRNELDKAENLCLTLLESPTVEGIQFAAQLYARQGRKEDAQQAISLLKQLNLKPGMQERLLGDHYARFVDPDKAIEQYRAATKEAPGNPAYWRTLIVYQIRIGRVNDAINTAKFASESVPNDDALRDFIQHSELVIAAKSDIRLRPIVLSLLGNNKIRSIAVETLKLLRNDNTETMLSTLRQLANSHTTYLALQNLASQMLAAAKRYEDAVAISTRAMETFPNAVEPARLATEAIVGTGRWEEALAIAKQWRQRSINQTLGPDLMIAEANLRLGNIQQASSQLKPYLHHAQKQPVVYAQVIIRYAKTLIASGNTEGAADLLKPLLNTSPIFRQAWIQLAAYDILDPDDAASWLNTAEPYFSTQLSGEKYILSSCWSILAQRFGDLRYHQQAKKIITEAVKDPNTTAINWFYHGILSEKDGEIESAETSYRNTLKIDPNHQAARNNLSMLLTTHETNLQEALELAHTAVRHEPRNPSYHDTLAFVQSRIKDYDSAIESIRIAISLDPTNPKWQTRLATIQKESQQ